MKTENINSAEKLLKDSPSAAFLTAGNSMFPLLRTHKDIVTVERVCHPLKKDDVPLYKSYGHKNLVLHRIIDVTADGIYVTRGDNTYTKEYVNPDNVVGVMTSIYRNGKHIDCKTSAPYKIYVKVTKFFYPVRWLWKVKIRPFLGRVKRKFFHK